MLVGDPTTGYSYKCLVSQVGGVTSVFGRTGAVTAQEGDYSLDQLSGVTITSPASGDILTYNGSSWVNGAGGFVPYTGANQNVNLGEYGIRSGWYQFDLTPTGTPTTASTMYWDDSFKTVALVMNGTTQEIGHDQFYHVKNSSGTTIPKGTAVGFAGTDGSSGHLLITPFIANGTTPSSNFMGVTAEAITNGSFGKVQNFGRLDGIDTSAFAEGDVLYVSTTTAGAFQTTIPVAPNNIIQVAAVVSDSNNGKLLIRPTLGSKLTSDESVRITSVANGNVLQYNSSLAVWQNVAPSSLAVSNIYTADGTLTGNRTVTMGGNSLTFTGTGYSILYAETTGASGAGYFVTKYGTALGYLGTYSDSSVRFSVASTNYTMLIHESGNGLIVGTKQASPLIFGTSDLQRMRIFAGGNIGINTTTDAGFRLDVNGTARFQNTITASGTITTSAANMVLSRANTGTSVEVLGGSCGARFNGSSSTVASVLQVYAEAGMTIASSYSNITSASALLDIQSTTRGILLPRMTTTQRNAIASPATGLIVYDTTNNNLDYYNGTQWLDVLASDFLTVDNANNRLGINTASPSYDLHVTGTSRITGNTEMSTASGAYMIVGATGDTSYRLSVDGDLRVYGNIRTAQPTGGTGVGVWRLGSTATGTYTMSTTVCVEIEIGGTLYKLATVS